MASETQGSGNAGDIVYSGTYMNGIVLNNPAMQNPATIAASGLVTNSGTAILGEPGTAWTVANDGTVEGSGTSGAGIVLKSGGLVVNGESSLIAGYSSGTLTNGIEITGTAPAASTGTVANNGTVRGGVSLSFFGSYYDNPASLGVVVNSGTIAEASTGVSIDAGDGTILNYGLINGTFSYEPGKLPGLGVKFTGFTTVNVDSGSVWRLAGADPDHRIVNDGTIAVYGEAVMQGQLVSDPGYNGVVSLYAGVVAKFGGTISASETVAFTGGTMNLASPLNFSGTISGFGGGDAIDLLHNAADGLSFAGHHLTVTNQGATVADLTFAGSYTAADFALSSDDHGGTDITFVAGTAGFLAMKS